MARGDTPAWAVWVGVGLAALVALGGRAATRKRMRAPTAAGPTPSTTPHPRPSWLTGEGSADVPRLLAHLGMPAPGAAEAPMSTAQRRAFDDWTTTVYAGRENEPPTERMLAALDELGATVSGRVPYRFASAMLSARDYVLTLADRTAAEETDLELKVLIVVLHAHPALHDKLTAWSWQTKATYPRRVPRDALRTWCEAFLTRFRESL